MSEDTAEKQQDSAALVAALVALKSPDWIERAIATISLGASDDFRAVYHLLHVLHTDENQSVRGAAAGALGKIGDPRAVEPLVSVLRERPKAPGQYYRDLDGGGREFIGPPIAAAAAALGEIGDLKAVEPLIVTLQTLGDDTRHSVVDALFTLRDERAIAPLHLLREDLIAQGVKPFTGYGQPPDLTDPDFDRKLDEFIERVIAANLSHLLDTLTAALEKLEGNNGVGAEN